MLEQDVAAIPDLRYGLALVVSEPPLLAARLEFDCRPVDRFLGLDVRGRRVRFSEHVVYRFEDRRIREVWSVLDRAAIEQQLADSEPASEPGPAPEPGRDRRGQHPGQRRVRAGRSLHRRARAE